MEFSPENVIKSFKTTSIRTIKMMFRSLKNLLLVFFLSKDQRIVLRCQVGIIARWLDFCYICHFLKREIKGWKQHRNKEIFFLSFQDATSYFHVALPPPFFLHTYLPVFPCTSQMSNNFSLCYEILELCKIAIDPTGESTRRKESMFLWEQTR